MLQRTKALLCTIALAGCGAADAYVPVDQIPPAQLSEKAGGDYVIASGDVLNVRVYNQDAISTRGRVRPDGRIGVPLAGEIEAVGRRPAELARDLEARLKPFVVAPSVVVGVEETQPVRVSVVGEVTRPGVYVLEPGTGVLDALAAAGGATEFADRERIFVVRKATDGHPLRIRFGYVALTRGHGRAVTFTLSTGDAVIVE